MPNPIGILPIIEVNSIVVSKDPKYVISYEVLDVYFESHVNIPQEQIHK